MRKLMKGIIAGSLFLFSTTAFAQVILDGPTVDLCPTAGGYTTLADIEIRETAATDITPAGGDQDTLIIGLPAGFEFNMAGTPGIVSTKAANFTSLSITYIDVDSLVIFYTPAANEATEIDTLTISGLEITAITENLSETLSITGGDATFAGSPTDLATINSLEIPDVTNAGTTETICDGSTTGGFTLQSDIGGATFSWTTTPTNLDATFTASSTGDLPSGETLTLTSSATNGSLVYTVTASNAGCEGPTQDFTVTVNAIPSVTNSEIATTVCYEDDFAGVTLNSDVGGASFAWTANINNVGNISGGTSGNGDIPASSMLQTNNNGGTVTYDVIPSNGICSGSTWTYTITVGEPVNPINLVSGTENNTIVVCQRQNVDYTINSSATNIAWSLSSNGGASFDGPTAGETTITLDHGILSDTLVVKQGIVGCQDSTAFVIEVFGCDFSGVTNNQDVCEGDQLNLALDSIPGSITPTYSWTVSNSNAFIIGNNDQNTAAIGINGTGSVDITFEVTHNSTYQITKTVNIQSLPVRLQITGPDDIMCGEQDVPFSSNGTGTHIWKIFDANNISGNEVVGTNNIQLDFNNNVNTAYVSVRKQNSSGCVLEDAEQGLVFTGGGNDAYNLDEKDNNDEIPTPIMNTTEGSIMFWVKTPIDWNGSGYNNSGIIYYGADAGTNGYGDDNGTVKELTIAMKDGGIHFSISRNSGRTEIESSTPILQNQWYHVAATWSSSGQISLYVNGTKQSVGFGSAHVFTFKQRHRFGRPRDDVRRFVGTIDNVSLWSKQLNDGDVTKYANQQVPPQDGLVAYYPFDPEDPLADASGNGNTISPESVSPTYEAANYYTDVKAVVINPFEFKLDSANNTQSNPPYNGSLSYVNPAGKTFSITNYDWTGSSYDGSPTATQLNTGQFLELTATNSAGCSFTDGATVPGIEGLTAGTIEIISQGAPFVGNTISVCDDSLINRINSKVAPSGGSTPLTHSWYYSINSSNWTKFSGQSSINFDKDTLMFNPFIQITRVTVDNNGDSVATPAMQFLKVTKTDFSINAINPEYCVNADLVNISATISSGEFLDGDDGYPYIVGTPGNQKLNPFFLNPEGSAAQPIIYRNVDQGVCPNFDTIYVSRNDTLGAASINFNLPANLTNTSNAFLLNPVPDSPNGKSDFECVNCGASETPLFSQIFTSPPYYPYMTPSGFKDAGQKRIKYTYTDPVDGCQSRVIKASDVSISDWNIVPEFRYEACSQEDPYNFIVEVGTNDTITDVYFAYDTIDSGIDGSPITNITVLSLNRWQVTVDPSKVANGNFNDVDTLYFEYIVNGVGPATSPPFSYHVFQVSDVALVSANLAPTFCTNDPSFTLVGNPSNQSYSTNGGNPGGLNATGVGVISSTPLNGETPLKLSGNTYNPSTGGWSGYDRLTYTYTVTSTSTGTVCVLTDDTLIAIQRVPDLDFVNIDDDSSHYCKNTLPFTIDVQDLHGGSGNGTFSGKGVDGAGLFNPGLASVTPGVEHTIKYTYTNDSTNCTSVATTVVVVDTIPYLEIHIADFDSIYCEDQVVEVLQGKVGNPASFGSLLNNQPNGYFSGSGIVSSDTTMSTGNFLASAVGSTDAFTTIKYTFTDGNECSNEETIKLKIRSLPEPTITRYERLGNISKTKGVVHPGFDWCQEDDFTLFEANNNNNNAIDAGGNPPSYSWFVNGQLRLESSNLLEESIDNFRDDSLNIRLRYTDQFGCIATVDSINFIHADPVVALIEPNHCLVDSIIFTDSSFVFTPEIDGIESWFWDFGDFVTQNDTITLYSRNDTAKWKYDRAGNYQVFLTVVSQWGCKSTDDERYIIEEDPVADFNWINDCIGVDDNGIQFTNKSSTKNTFEPPYSRYYWSFVGDDRGEPDPAFEKSYNANERQSAGINIAANIENDTVYYKYGIADINVSNDIFLVVETPLGCNDTIVKTITTRDYIVLAADSIDFTDFEAGNNGWFIDDSDEEAENTDWYIGDLDNTTKIEITNLYPGNTSYYIGENDLYKANSSSFVKSACYDLTALERPMISLKYIADMQALDGAVLQYSLDFGENWLNVGEFDGIKPDGINWYNSALIAATPGGILQQGWTRSTDGEWLEARHSLNLGSTFNTAKVVRFRMAFASNESGQREGFAFDEVWIGNRTRLILAEHFINTDNLFSSVQPELNGFMSRREYPLDIIDVQYPTSIELSGVVNRDLVGDKVSAYGYSYPLEPYTVMDGNASLGMTSAWMDDSTNIELRSLVDSPIKIGHSDEVITSTSLNVNIRLEATDSITHEKIRLKAVIIETEATILPNTNGSGQDSITIRHMMRNSLGRIAGEAITTLEDKGDVQYFNLTGDISLVSDTSGLAMIVYVQDEDTEEILQAYYAGFGTNTILTPLEDLVSGNIYNYLLYPNPAVNETNIVFDQALKSDFNVTMVNSMGNVVDVFTMESGTRSLSIPTYNYTSGMYILYISNEDQVLGVDKLVIQK